MNLENVKESDLFFLKILAVDEPDADDYFEDCKDEEMSDEQDSGKQDSEMQVEDQMIQSTDWHWEMPVEERWNQLDLLEAKFWKLVLKQIYCYSSHWIWQSGIENQINMNSLPWAQQWKL